MDTIYAEPIAADITPTGQILLTEYDRPSTIR